MSQEAEISVNEIIKMMVIAVWNLKNAINDPREMAFHKLLIDDFDFFEIEIEQLCQKAGIPVPKAGERLTGEELRQALEIINDAKFIEFTFSCELQRLKDVPITKGLQNYILKRWEGKTNLIIQITTIVKDYVEMESQDVNFVVDCRNKFVTRTRAFDQNTLIEVEPTHQNENFVVISDHENFVLISD